MIWMRQIPVWSALAPVLLCLATLLTTAGPAAADFSAAWTRQGDGPGKRGWMDMSYDIVNEKVILFGGSGSTYLNDIWQYDSGLDNWVRIEPFVRCDPDSLFPPTARDEHTLEYDEFGHLYWTFGGSGFACVGASRVAGAGTSVSSIVDPNLTANTNDFYVGFTAVSGTKAAYVSGYNAATRTLSLATPIATLTAGSSYKLYAQRGGGTWHYSPTTGIWTGFESPVWGYTGPRPINRLNPALAYSNADRALVMFGGYQFNDTWAMDVVSQTWIPMTPQGSNLAPPARAQIQNNMVYDRTNDVFVLFGGTCTSASRCQYGDQLNDTWTYRLSSNTWTRMSPPLSPPKRTQHTLVYDTTNNVTVLFGGRQGGTTFNDLWVYDFATNTWAEVPATAKPGGRYIAAMAYDEAQESFILYGGNNENNTTVHEVWSLTLDAAPNGGGNAPPNAIVSVSPSQGNVETIFQFDGANSTDDGVIVTYSWDFGDGTGASELAPTKQYNSPGGFTATLTVTDNEGASDSASTTVNVSSTEPLPSEIIIDNQDANTTRTGAWRVSSGANPWAGQSLYNNAGSNFRWLPVIDQAGPYQVFAWWTYHPNRSNNVPYRIGHASGVDTVTVNQVNPALAGQWIPLGTFNFDAHSPSYVEVSSENGQASADAIRLLSGSVVEVVVDNKDTNTSRTGVWLVSSGANPWAGQSLYNNAGSTFRWSPQLPAAGSYDVYVWWTFHPNRSSGVPYRISYEGGTDTVIVDQRNTSLASQWVYLGTYTFAAGNTAYVEVSSENGQASADAVRFVE